MLDLLWAPFLACLVLTGIHVYLGLHVLARGVIFVDLALAQVAALGMTVAFLSGHPMEGAAAYGYALAFAVGGAVVFSLSRLRRAPIPQEAVIGIVYAVAAAAAVLAVDRAPAGAEHIKQLLVGNILTVTPRDVGALALLYAAIGALHAVMRRPLCEISFAPAAAAARGRRLAAWDFCFYVTFAVVVTSSVRTAGVLLVFSYLIVPAAAATLVATSVRNRLLLGWALGVAVSGLGLWASYAWDLPTGAAVVATFGALMGASALAAGVARLVRRLRAEGGRALRGPAGAVAALGALAGALLCAFPAMDHPWLDALEGVLPSVQLAFLSPGERAAWRDSRDAIRRGAAEVDRARRLQQEAQWGERAMAEEQQERVRQFLAGRAEIVAGDRMVLATLRGRARERQRWWLGLPLAVLGSAGAWRMTRRPAGRHGDV